MTAQPHAYVRHLGWPGSAAYASARSADSPGETLTSRRTRSDVRRSLLPSGEAKRTKSDAGRRTIALFPELRRLLLRWKLKSPRTDRDDYVVCTHNGDHVAERNLRRALEATKTKAKIDGGEKRLSWHSLRHSAGSIWLTEYVLPLTTVSAMMGHSNPAFTLACYGRDPRDEQAIVTDVLARAAAATS